MPKTSFYQQMIREELALMGRVGTNSKHVEAFMRVEHHTLDGLRSFSDAVKRAVSDMDSEGMDAAMLDRLAASYGL